MRTETSQRNWESFLAGYGIPGFHSETAARRMIDDDFRMFWHAFADYEWALAENDNLITPHHMMGRILNRLSNGQFAELGDELYSVLAPDRERRLSLDIRLVRTTLAPLRSLAEETIAEAESRLGPIPPLEAVPLFDIDWLLMVGSKGIEPPKTRPDQLAIQRKRWGAAQEARRLTIREVTEALATFQVLAVDIQAAALDGNLHAVRGANDALFRKTVSVRAIRANTACYDLLPSLLAKDKLETLDRANDLLRATSETVSAAESILRA